MSISVVESYRRLFPGAVDFSDLPPALYPVIVEQLSLLVASINLNRKKISALKTGITGHEYASVIRFPPDQKHMELFLRSLSPSRAPVPSNIFSQLLHDGERVGGTARDWGAQFYPENLILAGVMKDSNPMGLILFLAGKSVGVKAMPHPNLKIAYPRP